MKITKTVGDLEMAVVIVEHGDRFVPVWDIGEDRYEVTTGQNTAYRGTLVAVVKYARQFGQSYSRLHDAVRCAKKWLGQ